MPDQTFVIEIDLNAVDESGATLVHKKYIVKPTLRMAALPKVGQSVLAVDEWKVLYPAVVDRIYNGFLYLSVKLDAPASHPTVPPVFEMPTGHYYRNDALKPANKTQSNKTQSAASVNAK